VLSGRLSDASVFFFSTRLKTNVEINALKCGASIRMIATFL
ncbi:Uncharacterized protein APZ42_006116, partial [Daphnia magna]